MLKANIETSGDGSHTVNSPQFNTLYHSHHGALSESLVVFIDAGLNFQKDNGYKRLSIFEMGFGTGLNALLAYQWAHNHQIEIYYHTVEAYPLDLPLIENLNYSEKCGDGNIFELLHKMTWGENHIISDYFTFKKSLSKIEELDIRDTYDVIFYDAFAPSSQSHLWEEPLLTKMYNILNKQGVLVTFCAQGAFKRHLNSIGFQVRGIPGPPGKREMTRAEKNPPF